MWIFSIPSDTNDSSGYNTALALVIITQSVIIRASEWSGGYRLNGIENTFRSPQGRYCYE